MVDDVLMSQLISYNQARFRAFKNGEVFEEIKDFQKIINARYCKISRIKKRVVFLIKSLLVRSVLLIYLSSNVKVQNQIYSYLDNKYTKRCLTLLVL